MRIYYEQTTLTYSIYCKKAKCTSKTEKLEEGERENNSGRSNADSNENWKPLEPLVHLKIPFSIIRLKWTLTLVTHVGRVTYENCTGSIL